MVLFHLEAMVFLEVVFLVAVLLWEILFHLVVFLEWEVIMFLEEGVVVEKKEEVLWEEARFHNIPTWLDSGEELCRCNYWVGFLFR